MIRLSAVASDHGFTFTLERDGELLFTTGNRIDLGEHMLAIGIERTLCSWSTRPSVGAWSTFIRIRT